MALELRSASIADTHTVAAAVASLARAGDIVVLAGEMGAGKTAFAQGFGAALGVTDRMTSPTFTLVHSFEVTEGPHAGRLTLHHADLYRLERTTEVADLALAELADFRGVVLVEWGDVVEGLFGDHLVVHLAPDDDGRDDGRDGSADDVFALDGRRRIEIAGVGETWAGRWDRLVEQLGDLRC